MPHEAAGYLQMWQERGRGQVWGKRMSYANLCYSPVVTCRLNKKKSSGSASTAQTIMTDKRLL